MNATMHDVARVAGVSIKTVSNVINDYPHVRATTRDRVLVAIKELGYQPNLSARGLRSGKTGVIGLAIPSVREAYFAELADSIIVAAEKRGLGVVVDQTNQVREHELDVIAGRRLRLTDGIVFSPVTIGEFGADLLNVPFPLVLLGESIFGGPTDHVTMHNVSSARAAVEHLLGIGRRRIALIGADDDEEANAFGSATLRVRGYHQALQAAGHPGGPGARSPRRALASRHRCGRDPRADRIGDPLRRPVRSERHARHRRPARPGRSGGAGSRRRGGHRVRQHRRDEVLDPVPVECRSRPGRHRRDRRGDARGADRREGRADAATPDQARLPHRRARIHRISLRRGRHRRCGQHGSPTDGCRSRPSSLRTPSERAAMRWVRSEEEPSRPADSATPPPKSATVSRRARTADRRGVSPGTGAAGSRSATSARRPSCADRG